jgi:hypothetical protein
MKKVDAILYQKVRIRGDTNRTAEQFETFWTKPSRSAIAGTCRQIYHEVAEIWYGDVRFYFSSLSCMMQFLEEIGEGQKEAIRYVGFKACWGPNDKLNLEILRSARINFPNLKSVVLKYERLVDMPVDF